MIAAVAVSRRCCSAAFSSRPLPARPILPSPKRHVPGITHLDEETVRLAQEEGLGMRKEVNVLEGLLEGLCDG